MLAPRPSVRSSAAMGTRLRLAWLLLALAACSKAEKTGSAEAHPGTPPTITIGLVAKSQGNAVFQAAYAGAKPRIRQVRTGAKA